MNTTISEKTKARIRSDIARGIYSIDCLASKFRVSRKTIYRIIENDSLTATQIKILAITGVAHLLRRLDFTFEEISAYLVKSAGWLCRMVKREEYIAALCPIKLANGARSLDGKLIAGGYYWAQLNDNLIYLKHVRLSDNYLVAPSELIGRVGLTNRKYEIEHNATVERLKKK